MSMKKSEAGWLCASCGDVRRGSEAGTTLPSETGEVESGSGIAVEVCVPGVHRGRQPEQEKLAYRAGLSVAAVQFIL